jgi:hypothetical protein
MTALTLLVSAQSSFASLISCQVYQPLPSTQSIHRPARINANNISLMCHTHPSFILICIFNFLSSTLLDSLISHNLSFNPPSCTHKCAPHFFHVPYCVITLVDRRFHSFHCMSNGVVSRSSSIESEVTHQTQYVLSKILAHVSSAMTCGTRQMCLHFADFLPRSVPF